MTAPGAAQPDPRIRADVLPLEAEAQQAAAREASAKADYFAAGAEASRATIPATLRPVARAQNTADADEEARLAADVARRSGVSAATATALARVTGSSAAVSVTEAPAPSQIAIAPPPPPGDDRVPPLAPDWDSSARARSGLVRLRIGGHVCSRAALEDFGSTQAPRPPIAAASALSAPAVPVLPPAVPSLPAAEFRPDLTAAAASASAPALEPYVPSRPEPLFRPEPVPAPELVTPPPLPPPPRPARTTPPVQATPPVAPLAPPTPPVESPTPAAVTPPGPENLLSPGAFASTSASIQLGIDQRGRPLRVRPFDEQPNRIALVGGYWPAHLIAARALEAGAWVLIVTGNPSAWGAFTERSPHADHVRLIRPNPPADITEGIDGPILVVDDAWALGRPMPSKARTAVLNLIPRVTPQAAPHLKTFGLVALHQPDEDQADLVSESLGLNTQHTAAIRRLAPDMLALFGQGIGYYVWMSPAPEESIQFGPPAE